MKNNRPSCRDIKEVLAKLLKTGDQELISAGIKEYRPRQTVNALFSYIYSNVPEVRWGAITAMGKVVGLMAEEDMESARNIIRRLMWNLNDESGGIGWGSPEAMAEILIQNNTICMATKPLTPIPKASRTIPYLRRLNTTRFSYHMSMRTATFRKTR